MKMPVIKADEKGPELASGSSPDLPLMVIPAKDEKMVGCFKGLSYWLSWLRCRRRYDIDRMSGQAFSGDDATVGKLFHKLLEIYYKGDFDKVVLSYEKPTDPNWLEATRLFSAYRELFPATEFGKVVACEIISNHGARGWENPANRTTEDVEKSRECMEIFGVPELGGIIDMVVDIDEAALEVLKASRMFHDGLEPGRYLLDTKTKKQRATNMEIQFLRDLQFQTYMVMAERDPSLGPVKGMIANAVIRHTKLEDKKSFVSTVVPPPAAYHREFVKKTLTKAYRMREDSLRHGDTSPANPEWCSIYGGCPHQDNGLCDRL